MQDVSRSLPVGGEVNVMAPVYPEDLTGADNYTVGFFPSFFLGCAMGQGGPQKMWTYEG